MSEKQLCTGAGISYYGSKSQTVTIAKGERVHQVRVCFWDWILVCERRGAASGSIG